MTQVIAIDPVSRIGGHLRVEVDIDGGEKSSMHASREPYGAGSKIFFREGILGTLLWLRKGFAAFVQLSMRLHRFKVSMLSIERRFLITGD